MPRIWRPPGRRHAGQYRPHPRLKLPNLARLGIGNIKPLAGIAPAESPRRLRALHAGLAGQGHHHRALGNGGHPPGESLPALSARVPARDHDRVRAAHRPQVSRQRGGVRHRIIKDLGPEHMRTGSPIVYTSADSVFQVAAHEEVIPIPELYRICETAREILRGPYEVGRVIARPFVARRAVSRAPPTATITPCRRPRACCSTGSRSAASRSTAWARSSTCFWTGHPGIGEDQEQRRWHGQDH